MNLRRGVAKYLIGDVDRDALLALSAKAIGEIREIDLAAAGDVRGALERLELILHQAIWSRRAACPMSVDFPSSTDPQVLKRRRSTG